MPTVSATIIAIIPRSRASGGLSTSWESSYETDPDYSRPPPQSQPCNKHGVKVKYIPAGMRRVYIKKRKLDFES